MVNVVDVLSAFPPNYQLINDFCSSRNRVDHIGLKILTCMVPDFSIG
jgi:hypothetical protein